MARLHTVDSFCSLSKGLRQDDGDSKSDPLEAGLGHLTETDRDGCLVSMAKSGDFFAYVDRQGNMHSNLLSLTASCLASVVMMTLWVIAVVAFFTLESSVDIDTFPRPTDAHIPVPFLVAHLTANGTTPFFDPSYFRFSTRFRIIFEGFANPERPPINIDIPMQDCETFFDLDGQKASHSPVKVEHGCPNMTALREELSRMRDDALQGVTNRPVADVPETPYLQGSFGEDTYMFFEFQLQPCSTYGPRTGIQCAANSEVDELFSKQVSISVDWIQNVSTGASWGSLFDDVRRSEIKKYEMFFRKTDYRTFRRDLPVISKSDGGLKFEHHFVRTSDPHPGSMYTQVIFRMDDFVVVERTLPKSVFILGAEIGGARTVAILIAFLLFGLLNHVISTSPRRQDDSESPATFGWIYKRQGGSEKDLRPKAFSRRSFGSSFRSPEASMSSSPIGGRFGSSKKVCSHLSENSNEYQKSVPLENAACHDGLEKVDHPYSPKHVTIMQLCPEPNASLRNMQQVASNAEGS